MDRRRRASLALTLNFIALLFAVSALTTSYWCEGTRKVVKPLCTGPVTTKQSYCIRFNSSNLNDTRLVQYIWETGEDKFVLRKFHSGIWFSCEQNVNMIGKNVINPALLLPTHLRQSREQVNTVVIHPGLVFLRYQLPFITFGDWPDLFCITVHVMSSTTLSYLKEKNILLFCFMKIGTCLIAQ